MKKLVALLMALLLALSILGCSNTPEAGKVFYLNCEPEANEAWQKLAAAYSDAFGVEVTVRTVTTDDCATAVGNALGWENAPTAFQLRDSQDLEPLKNHCLDLTGSAVLSQMLTGSFNLTDGGSVKAVCYSYSASGLMVNTALLDAAGYQLSDIQDFETLSRIAADIHTRSEDLGFDAFAALNSDGSTAWQLAQSVMARQTDESDSMTLLRQGLDLMLSNASPLRSRAMADEGLPQFAQGTAVFCLHSASVYDTLLSEPYLMEGDKLAMIPLYCGGAQEENLALSCVPQGYWAVNSGASAADRKATLDFLNWVVTSELGISLLQEEYGGVPFKAAKEKNGFFADSNALLAGDRTPVISPLTEQDARKAAFTQAVADYALEQTEENWKKIEEVFDDRQA